MEHENYRDTYEYTIIRRAVIASMAGVLAFTAFCYRQEHPNAAKAVGDAPRISLEDAVKTGVFEKGPYRIVEIVDGMTRDAVVYDKTGAVVKSDHSSNGGTTWSHGDYSPVDITSAKDVATLNAMATQVNRLK